MKPVGPVPPGIFNTPDHEPAGLEWFTNLIVNVEKTATTTEQGRVLKGTAVANLNLTISNPPTQAQVQAISNKVDQLLAVLRTAGLIET